MKRPLPHVAPPIGELLDDGVEEARLNAIWRGTERRLAGRPLAVRPLVGAAALVAAAIGIAFFALRGPEHLEVAGGGVPVAVDVSARSTSARTVRFADRSAIEIAPGARIVPRRNDGARFETEVERGRVTFDVVPGGERRWAVVAGPTTVEVLGTRFVVTRTAGATRVEVERGVVQVSGPQGRRVLRRGDAIEMADAPPAVAEIGAPSSGAGTVQRAAGDGAVGNGACGGDDCAEGALDEDAAASDEPCAGGDCAAAVGEARGGDTIDADGRRRAGSQGATKRPAGGREPDWRRLATDGEHRQAYVALGQRGIAERTEQATAAELLLLADVARLSGHPGEAVVPLERLLREHPTDARAGVAAIILGRIEMDVLHRPARARAAFERARALGVPAALAADVASRLERLSAADEPTTGDPPATAPAAVP